MRFLSCLTVCLLATTSATWGQITWQQREVKVNADTSDREASARFAFTNEGDSPVTITSVTTSCGCTTAELEQKTYEPGQSGEIKARFAIGSRVGEQTKRIIVRTDNEDSPITTLTMRVMIPEVLRIRPRMVYWRAEEERKAKTVRIQVVHDEPVEILRVEADSDAVAAKLKKQGDGSVYVLTLTPRDTAPPTNIRLRLITNLEQERDKAFGGFTLMARLLPGPEDDVAVQSATWRELGDKAAGAVTP